jgi:hypothetical protein
VLAQRQFERDLEEEMQFHLALKQEANREAGMNGEDAARAAPRDFGNATSLWEASRDAWDGLGSKRFGATFAMACGCSSAAAGTRPLPSLL